jgi:hypothetical protein
VIRASLSDRLQWDDDKGITMVISDNVSPSIDRISWGRMEVAGLGVHKDFKLWPGGGRNWDWRESDTHHSPGIQPADIEELLENGCESVVLSRGMLLRLRISPETLVLLNQRQIPVHIVETKAAVAIYNGMAARGEMVGGLFHSTC